MANFQKVPNDHNTRFDAEAQLLMLMLEEHVNLDLWGGGPNGEDLVVDAEDPSIVSVSESPIKIVCGLQTFSITALRSGTTMLRAKVLNGTPADYSARRRLWALMPTYISIKVQVMGAEYRQGDEPWGNVKYGSTNPAWKNVKWTTMAQAGCGPTSLADVIDYLVRLDQSYFPGCLGGVDPRQTMDYTSHYGRAAKSSGEPSGTSGETMINNVSIYWPDLEGQRHFEMEEVIGWLRRGTPLIFLCKGCTTYKYDKKGRMVKKKWDGHFMVVLGVEHDGQTFWITDPSRGDYKYISRAELAKCLKSGGIWRVYRKTPENMMSYAGG